MKILFKYLQKLVYFQREVHLLAMKTIESMKKEFQLTYLISTEHVLNQ